MQIGAVIVAAGMSSRMGDFKPMLNIGSMSIAKRIVATLKQAGVDKIVMITGYHADDLERHLAGNGIIFFRNENYSTTQMFDSAKIGFEYLKDKCGVILFTPVDIPLFTSSTVSALLNSEAELACPVFQGQSGHPILLSSDIAEKVIKDSGEGGLQGALERCGVDFSEVLVDDEGILHDADTRQDYDKLLLYHNHQLARPVVSVALAKETSFFDNQTAMLLQLIEETFSVRTACQRMQISYSSGWNMIRNLENQMCRSIVSRIQGGAGGGNSRLTEEGKRLLMRYMQYEESLRTRAAEEFPIYFDEIFEEMKK